MLRFTVKQPTPSSVLCRLRAVRTDLSLLLEKKRRPVRGHRRTGWRQAGQPGSAARAVRGDPAGDLAIRTVRVSTPFRMVSRLSPFTESMETEPILPIPAVLLVAKNFDGAQAGGLDRGVGAEQDSNGGGYPKGQ